jgi:hypothetical protein
MAQEEHIDEQIKPEKFNMILLEYLIKNPLDFWNVNEISGKAANKTLNNSRVKKSIIYFANKNFVTGFSKLSFEDQKKIKRDRVKEITSESYQITKDGIDIYEKITQSCLDPVGQRLLN